MEIGGYMDNNKDLKVVFMGTPSFAKVVLEGLIDIYNVVLVVCQPDRKKDRKGNMDICEVKRLSISNDIEVFQPVRIREEYQKIIDINPDMIITCAYGQIIPNVILNCPKYGCINVHASLLPKLRGGAPIHWAIINGYEETGVTIMHMSEKMDAGDIISQKSIEISRETILDDLYKDLSILGRDLLLETIPKIIDGSADRIKQNEELVTFGYNIKKSDEIIDFSKDGHDIVNLIRGLNSIPGAYSYLDKKRMKIFLAEYVEDASSEVFNYGEIIMVEADNFKVRCNNGYIKVYEIQLEGKKRCKVYDYFNGIDKNMLIGKVLECEK